MTNGLFGGCFGHFNMHHHLKHVFGIKKKHDKLRNPNSWDKMGFVSHTQKLFSPKLAYCIGTSLKPGRFVL